MSTFRIQEFAKLAGVTVRALHHYDRLQLLSPAHRSERRYRLYCHEDPGRLERILALRYLGLSLRQIADLLDTPAGRGAEPLTVTLARQQPALRERRDGLDRVLRAIEQAQRRAQNPTEPEWLLYQTILKEIQMQEATDWTAKYYSPRAAGMVPSSWITGAVALLLGLGILYTPPAWGWFAVGALLALDAAFLILVATLSRRTGWDERHTLSLAAGGALAYGTHAFTQRPLVGGLLWMRISNAVFLICAVWLIGTSALGLNRKTTRASRSPNIS